MSVLLQTHLVIALVVLYLCGVGPTEGVSSSAPSTPRVYAAFLRDAALQARDEVLAGKPNTRPARGSGPSRCCAGANKGACMILQWNSASHGSGSVADSAMRLKGGSPQRPLRKRQGHENQEDFGQGRPLNDLYGGGPSPGGGSQWMQAILASDPAAQRVGAVLSGCFFYSHESFVATVSTLAFLIGNAARDPSDLAWRRVRRSNAALWERLGEDGFRVLQACGYRQEYRTNEVLYSLEPADTAVLAAAEKVLLAARDFGLPWLRAELANAQRRPRPTRPPPAAREEWSSSEGELAEEVSCLERDLGLRTVREGASERGVSSSSVLAVVLDDVSVPCPKMEVAVRRRRRGEHSDDDDDFAEAGEEGGEAGEWVEEEAGALAGCDHVLLESSDALQRLEARGYEPGPGGALVLRGPGGWRFRVTPLRRGEAGRVWLVLSVGDLDAARRFWGGLLGMREAPRPRRGQQQDQVRMAFRAGGREGGGWGVVLSLAARSRSPRRGGQRLGVAVKCPPELMDEVQAAAEARGLEASAPRRQRLFGSRDKRDAMQLLDPDGRRVTLADVDDTADLDDDDDLSVVTSPSPSPPPRRATPAPSVPRARAGLQERFLDTKLRELARIDVAARGETHTDALVQPASALTKLLAGVRSWVRGGSAARGGKGEGRGAGVEVLVELMRGVGEDLAAHGQAASECGKRQKALEAERRGAERGVRAAREKLVEAEERAVRAEEAREKAEAALEGAKAELQSQFAEVMAGLGVGEGRAAGRAKDPLGRATAKCDAAGGVLARAKKSAEEAREAVERAEAKLRAEEERGQRAEEEAAGLEERERQLAGEAEALCVAVREGVDRTRSLLQQWLGVHQDQPAATMDTETGADAGAAQNHTQAAAGQGGKQSNEGTGWTKETPPWAQALLEQIQGSVGALSRAVQVLAQDTREIRAHVGMVDGHVGPGLGANEPGVDFPSPGFDFASEKALREAEAKYAEAMAAQQREQEESERRLRAAEAKLEEAEARAGRLEREVSVLQRRRGASVGLEDERARARLSEVEGELREAKQNTTAAETKLEEIRRWVSERWAYMQPSPSDSDPQPGFQPDIASPPQDSSPARTPWSARPSGGGSVGFESRASAASPFSVRREQPQTPRADTARGAAVGAGLAAARRSQRELDQLLAQAEGLGREGGAGQARGGASSPSTPKEDAEAVEEEEWWLDQDLGPAGELLRIEDHTLGAAPVRLQATDDVLHAELATAELVARLAASTSPSGRVHLRSGQFMLHEVETERRLALTADDDAVALGRWRLQAGSSGDFAGVKLVNVAAGLPGQPQSEFTPPTLRAWMQPCMVAVAGPWSLDHCELRSSGGVALRCSASGDVALVDSGVGGLGLGPDLASMAISMQGQARCEVLRCMVDKTIAKGGGGVRCRENCVSRVVGSVIQMNAHGVSCSGSAKVEVRGCLFINNRDAAVCVMEDAWEAELEVRGNTILGDEFVVQASQPKQFVDEGNRVLSRR